MLKIAGGAVIAIVLFLSGAFLVLWYDDEHGEGKRLKKQLEDSRYAKENSEKELQKTIWENCGKKNSHDCRRGNIADAKPWGS